jgi:hypothetical protein
VHHKKGSHEDLFMLFFFDSNVGLEQSVLAENTAELSEKRKTFYAYHICEFFAVVYEKESRNA